MADNSLVQSHFASQVPLNMVDAVLPGFSFLSKFYANYFGIDLTGVFAWLVLVYASGNTVGYAWEHIKSFFRRWFTCSITVSATDRLHRQVLQWVSVHVVKENSRFMAAYSAASSGEINNEDIMRIRMGKRPKVHVESFQDSDSSIQYYPSYRGEWFFHKRRLVVLQRSKDMDRRSQYFMNGDPQDPIVLTTPGLSPEPLKLFLKTCEEFALKSRESMTTIYTVNRSYGSPGWDVAIARPSRPLDTVDLDEETKTALLNDIREYLHPSSRKFYARRGIPYRRGYLFHGQPGTGKTSLSVALAGTLNLELYTASLSNKNMSDRELSGLFATLPPSCIVLLEDIDVAGMSREVRAEKHAEYLRQVEASSEREPGVTSHKSSKDRKKATALMDPFVDVSVTLSGLLNALDGVSSQEGRVLIMTTNDPESLDKALIRPGRVDMQVRFGPISQKNAYTIFRRFYTWETADGSSSEQNGSTEAQPRLPLSGEGIKDAEMLESMAVAFAGLIPEERLTPAEVQGFLLMHKSCPKAAVDAVSDWVNELLAAKEKNKNIIKAEPRAQESIDLEGSVGSSEMSKTGQSDQGSSESPQPASTAENGSSEDSPSDIKSTKAEAETNTKPSKSTTEPSVAI